VVFSAHSGGFVIKVIAKKFYDEYHVKAQKHEQNDYVMIKTVDVTPGIFLKLILRFKESYQIIKKK